MIHKVQHISLNKGKYYFIINSNNVIQILAKQKSRNYEDFKKQENAEI